MDSSDFNASAVQQASSLPPQTDQAFGLASINLPFSTMHAISTSCLGMLDLVLEGKEDLGQIIRNVGFASYSLAV